MRAIPWLLLALAACSSESPKTPPSLAERLPSDRARAGVIRTGDELVGGPTSVGGPGDFKLYNARIAVVVEKPGPSDGYDAYGGLVVDADVIRAPGEPGHSRFGEAIPVYNFRTLRGVSAEVVDDGTSGGAARVRVHAVDDAFPLIEAVLGQNRPPMNLEVTIDYVLEPGVDFLRIITTLKNPGTETVYVGDQYLGYVMGDGLKQFLTGHGFDIPDLPRPAPFYAAVADDVSYSFVTPDSDFAPVIQFQGFLLGALGKFPLPGGVENTIEMDLVVGDGDLSKHVPSHRALLTAAGREVEEAHTISGRVTDGAGPIGQARVHAVVANGRDYVMQAVSRSDGTFDMLLPSGRYKLTATRDGRDAGASVDVDATADRADVTISVGPTGALKVLAKSSTGELLPAKVMLTRSTPPAAPPKSFGLTPRYGGYERILFIPAAGQRVELPPGTWQVVVSRGFEYEIARREVVIESGKEANVEAILEHSVDTTGWLSGDYHVHSQWSPDSDELVTDKVLAFAGEGLEVPVSTEHEYIADLQPVVERLGLSTWVHAVIGEEVSTTPLGHFNAFPLAQDPLLANFGALSWYGVRGADLLAAMRGLGPRPLVQVNHPRSGSFGAPIIKGYFTAVGFDPATFTVQAPHDWSTDFDAMEVANGGSLDYEDWFPFLDRGVRLLGTGDSDSHTSSDDAVGYPRNMVRLGVDTPEGLDVDGYMASLRAGRLSVCGGYFITMTAGDAQLGELVKPADGKMTVHVRVQAPSWVPAGTLEVLRNGVVVASQALGNTQKTDRFDADVEVPTIAGEDGWIVARVTSSGQLDPVYPGGRAFGFTNPVFVDGNGNGTFDARVR